MSTKNNPTHVDVISRDLDYVFPKFAQLVTAGLVQCGKAGLRVEVFEAYRSPQRQEHLYHSGRLRPGAVVTRAKQWESWHNYGLAVDIVFKDEKGQWTWEGEWSKVTKIFTDVGLEGLTWEKPHFQMCYNLSVKQAREINERQGMQAVWAEIYSRYTSKVAMSLAAKK